MKKRGLSRRAFLGSAAATMAAASGASLEALAAETRSATGAASPAANCSPRANILTLYLAKPVPTWPRPDFDPQDDIRRIRPILEGFEAKPEPAVRFFGHELLRVPDDLFHLQPSLRQADGLLVFNLTSTVMNLLGPLSEVGMPLVLFSQPYSGHDWSQGASLRAKGRRVEVVASSDFDDLETPLRVLAARQRMRQSRVVCISPETEHSKSSRALEERFGTPIRFVEYSRLQSLYQAANLAAAHRDAVKFMGAALKVVEPKPSEVADSFRLYHAVEKLLEEERANAITIDCLGGFHRRELPAYPCVAWSKLNDRGLHGVCEADLETTFTQMLFGHYSGKPGFVSDPVIDTRTNTVIHAHCVAATRMDGPRGPAAPYIVRSHMEDNKGVSMQVNMRVGQTVTVVKLADANTLLVSTGRIVATPDLPRGCRTKVATQVRNAAKMLENYGGGLHRVLFYGDHLRAAHQMGHLLGLQVVEET
jgi:hypothetical protein